MVKFISILFFFSLLIISCNKRTYESIYPALTDGKYDSEFPYKQCSDQLSKVIKSVKKIISTSEYVTYVFEEDVKLTLADLDIKTIESKSVKKEFANDNKSASGTLIYRSGRKLAFLTCAHAITFPDSVITYYEPLYPGAKPFIFSVSFKTKQNYYVTGFERGIEVDILAKDSKADIAILGTDIDAEEDAENVSLFRYPFGIAKELEWGSFVYIIGYPKGLQMITRGIVSSPNRDGHGSFLIDALFNEGISGGIILAIRDGVPNFELVGIVKSVSATTDYVIKPFVPNYEISYNPNIPYTGDLKLKRTRDINYGISFAVSSELILKFLKKSNKELLKKGFDLSELYEN